MSDFVAETANLSTADWTGGADAHAQLEALRESALQANLSTLEATLWTAETGFGSAGAAIEMTKLARQTREQSLSLFRKVTMAR
jgi:hypothetical protein